MSQDKKIESNSISICKVDLNFNITYANSAFIKETGYSLSDLINESIAILRHPKMPMTINNQLMENLLNGSNYNVISLEITKNGTSYWVVNNLTIDKDSSGNTVGYTTRRKSVPQQMINKINSFYKDLYQIENSEGNIAAKFYFLGYFAGKDELYADYIVSLFEEEIEVEKSISKKTMDWFFKTEYCLE